MNLRTPLKLSRLLGLVRNPAALAADRLGWRRAPYRLQFWNGLQIELRPGRGDLTAFRESWIQADYLPLESRLGPGDTALDVGANVGCFTLQAAQRVGPTGRVIALEPDAESFAQLQLNVALNGLKNVVLRRAAVAGHSGSVRLYRQANALYHSLYGAVDGRGRPEESEAVPAVTLEQLLREEDVPACHYLKLDCEGAEHAIVAALDRATAERVAQIGMELHELPGQNAEELLRRLEEFGFAVRRRGAIAFCQRSHILSL